LGERTSSCTSRRSGSDPLNTRPSPARESFRPLRAGGKPVR